MPGCCKCRFLPRGCAKCNPGRFTLRSRCSGKAKHAVEHAVAFRKWLVASQGLGEGTAKDYAWALKCLLQLKGIEKRGSPKMQTVLNHARSHIDVFFRRRSFHTIAAAAEAAKVQEPSKAPAAEVKKGQFGKQLRIIAKKAAGRLKKTAAEAPKELAGGKLSSMKALKPPIRKLGSFAEKTAKQRPEVRKASTELSEAVTTDHGSKEKISIAGKMRKSMSKHLQSLARPLAERSSERAAKKGKSLVGRSMKIVGVDAKESVMSEPCIEEERTDIEDSTAGEAAEPVQSPSKCGGPDADIVIIAESLRSAGHLSSTCRGMLADMLPFSLAVPEDERMECQQRVVAMAEEALSAVKAELEAVVIAADAKLSELDSNMADLEGASKAADSQFANWSLSWRAQLDEALAAMNASGELLTKRTLEHEQSSAKLEVLRKNIDDLQTAFQKHFQQPLAAGRSPNLKDMKPFLQTMDLDESLRRALPRICAKADENRSEEDDAVLEQLTLAFAMRTSTMTEELSEQTEAASKLAAAVKKSEADYHLHRERKEKSTAEFEAALKQQGGGEEALLKGFIANQAVADLRPKLDAARRLRDFAAEKLIHFEGTALAKFVVYKARTSVEVPKQELLAQQNAPLSDSASSSSEAPRGEEPVPMACSESTAASSLEEPTPITCSELEPVTTPAFDRKTKENVDGTPGSLASTSTDVPFSEADVDADDAIDETGLVDMLSAEFGVVA